MSKIKSLISEFIAFVVLQARACIFAGSFFLLLALSTMIHLPGLYRYDFLFLSALLIQAILIYTKIETVDEAKTIVLFHVLGLCLELFKTHPAVGSWSYPELGFFKIGTVPLYSGFMYAAVGSYVAQAWRLEKLSVTNYPKYVWTIPLVALIYGNFFTNRWFTDIRSFLFVAIMILFWRTRVHFTFTTVRRSMPLWLSFILIGFFIWVAENFATLFGAWQYPHQAEGWHLVGLGKISSWILMVILSIVIVFDLKMYKEKTAE